MSQTTTVTGLALWLTLTRTFGQSALSVVSLAIVGHWFVRRIDTAMAVYSVLMSIGFMIAFPTVGWLVQTAGWRIAWFTIGGALIVGLAPAAWLVVRRSPEACGLWPDGAPAADDFRQDIETRRKPALTAIDGHSWRAAIATPAFWVFAAGTALYGLVASGIGLFNESILAERGFGPAVYYQSLVVTAMMALVGNFAGGWLARFVNPTVLLAGSLAVLAAGVAVLPVVSALGHVIAWAAAMGLGGGVVMVVFFSVWARVFGRRDLGRIQGAAQALTVLASAIGPVLLAWSIEWTGSYAPVFRLLAGLILCVAVAGLLVNLPAPPSLPEVASSESR
jgi:MFS family permease